MAVGYIGRHSKGCKVWDQSVGCPYSLVFLGFSMSLDTLPYTISLQARWRQNRSLVMPREPSPATEGPPHPWGIWMERDEGDGLVE